MIRRAVVAVLVALLALPFVPAAAAHYTPSANDQFTYDETVLLNDGIGNYSGYTESTAINGTIAVVSILPNGSDESRYYNENHYQNSEGQQESWSSSGRFAFSPQSFLYDDGTDNQTGYTNPSVWFFVDNDVAAGGVVTLLNSPLLVVSTSVSYPLGTPAGSYVKAIFAEGNGSYERDDAYGTFTATYNWKAYFDPSTGFIIAYLYTETDTDGPASGFTLVDSLAVMTTSYPLTPDTATSSSSSSGSSTVDWLLVGAVVAVVLIVIIVVVVIAVARARRRHPMPRHSGTGRMTFAPPPVGAPPPPINLTPSGQPAVQQIIIKETVKVNCRYCGSLIDSTAEKCPFCGAVRT